MGKVVEQQKRILPTWEDSAFKTSDEAALKYIAERGYASYSSLKNVRDKVTPQKTTTQYFEFGTELHSRFLEKTVIKKLTPDEERLIKATLTSLNKDKLVQMILKGATFEQKFHEPLYGVPVLGYIDIKRPKECADLKTTHCPNEKQFIEAMDFLQPALYMAVTKTTDFYYIGVSKTNGKVFTFNVNRYPARIKEAKQQLITLLKYVKEKINFGDNKKEITTIKDSKASKSKSKKSK